MPEIVPEFEVLFVAGFEQCETGMAAAADFVFRMNIAGNLRLWRGKTRADTKKKMALKFTKVAGFGQNCPKKAEINGLLASMKLNLQSRRCGPQRKC